MNPFFFGSSDRLLFGSHEAAARSARDTCVVVVPPMGQEGIRAQRWLRQLALKLGRERYHALRFDLFGSGDSAGEFEEATLSQWVEDTRTAMEELRGRTGCARVSLVGVRLGAAIAWLAAAGRRDVDRLILVEPVLRGAPYLAELRRRHVEFLRGELPERRAAFSAEREILGFPLTRALEAELLALDLLAGGAASARGVAALVTKEGAEEAALRAAVPSLGPRATWAKVETAKDWNSDEAVNTSLVPVEIVDAVVASLGER